MKKIILWDWDGTLVNSLPYKYEEIWSHVFEGNEEAQNIVRDFIKTPEGKRCNRYGLIAYTLQKTGELSESVEPSEDPIVEKYAALYKEGAANAIPTFGLLPGAQEVLEKLSGEGHHMHLVSGGGSDEDLDQLLTNIGVRKFFNGVFGFGISKAVGTGFGKHDNFLRIAEIEGVSAPEQYVVIGDTPKDKEFAQKIGCDFIGVANQYNEWTPSKDPKVAANLLEVPGLLS
tara:strand:- start:15729 stop:16418 length:690 start_codon:yes stop_codon:yes gene_type:complete